MARKKIVTYNFARYDDAYQAQKHIIDAFCPDKTYESNGPGGKPDSVLPIVKTTQTILASKNQDGKLLATVVFADFILAKIGTAAKGKITVTYEKDIPVYDSKLIEIQISRIMNNWRGKANIQIQ